MAAEAVPILSQIDVAIVPDLRYRSAPNVAPDPARRYPSDVARFQDEPVQEAHSPFVVVPARAALSPSDDAPGPVRPFPFVVAPVRARRSPCVVVPVPVRHSPCVVDPAHLFDARREAPSADGPARTVQSANVNDRTPRNRHRLQHHPRDEPVTTRPHPTTRTKRTTAADDAAAAAAAPAVRKSPKRAAAAKSTRPTPTAGRRTRAAVPDRTTAARRKARKARRGSESSIRPTPGRLYKTATPLYELKQQHLN